MGSTLRDVAARAGVHAGTASRALNPATRHLVNHETARRVAAAARALSYEPNPLARGLRTSRSFTVGVLIPDLTNPLFPPIVRGIEDRLSPAGYAALLANADNPAREQDLVARLRARQVDGFILATARREDPLVSELAASSTPIVLVNRLTDSLPVDGVAPDDDAGIRDAVAHLVTLGHSRIGHVAGPQTISTGFERRRGFDASMREAGLRAARRDIVTAASFTEDAGRTACGTLLRRGRFTGIVAANDLLALGCYTAIREAGLVCPDDVSVIGFNDMPFVDKLAPALTTVAFPHHQLGFEAASLLLARIEQPDIDPRVVRLKPHLVVRASTRAVRGHNVGFVVSGSTG
jgi:LacI family transcriptional regulator